MSLKEGHYIEYELNFGLSYLGEGRPTVYDHTFQLILVQQIIMVLIIEGKETTPVITTRSLYSQVAQTGEDIVHVVELEGHAVELYDFIYAVLNLLTCCKIYEGNLKLLTFEAFVQMPETGVLESKD